jgi:hypothetical protein
MKTIIAAYTGTGKTYFSSLYPELTIDLVCMPYKYILTNEKPFSESSKANPDWPNNYISAIKQNFY